MGYRGAKVAGQREWGWVQQELGIPTFPQDYPESEAAVTAAKVHAAEQVKAHFCVTALPN